MGARGASLSTHPGVLIKNRSLEDLVDLMGKFWFELYPHELREYIVQVKLLKESLLNGTGMAPSKDFAQRGTIPDRVMAWGNQIVPGMWKSGGIELWFKRFPAFDPRTSRMGRFGAGA